MFKITGTDELCVMGGRQIDQGRQALAEWVRTRVHQLDKKTKVVLAGHNISNFDLRFLEHKGIDIQDICPSIFDYHVFDLWPLLITMLGPEYCHLKKAAAKLELGELEHTGISDAELAASVYRHIKNKLR